MNEKYNVYLVSDSTGETLDRIFLSLKSQFANFEYDKKEFAFVRTEQQIDKIIKECSLIENSIILYTIVETKLAKYLASQSEKKSVPCFGVLGNLILSFSKLLNQKPFINQVPNMFWMKIIIKELRQYNLQWYMMMEKK